MNAAEDTAARLQRVFTDIQNERMAGIPILNQNLYVETVGFSEFEGRCLGVLITPWLMNLIMLPALGEDWSQLVVGHKETHEFPSGRRDFLVNEFDDIGICQTQALFSPMFGFKTQDQARISACQIMDGLMLRADPEQSLDEERLERFINGEDMAQIQRSENEAEAHLNKPSANVGAPPAKIARSDFIRGKFSGKGRS